MAVLVMAPEFFFPLRQFAEDYHATLDGKNAMKDINRVKAMSELKEIDVLGDDFSYDNNTKIKVKNLSYQYDNNNKMSVDNISFEIKGYKKIAIIGYSGAGKSTLLNIMGGFLQGNADSKIYINDLELDGLTDKNWQKEIIYIPQNPYIFSGSILDNMRFYNPSASVEEVRETLIKVGLKDFVDEMKDGLYTIIGEGGRSISGGQAQRIAIARAFLSPNRKILLLDEPSAHLDIETEVELKKYILELAKDRLMLLSTHRLHWTKDMDEIMVVENGKLVQKGSLDVINAIDGEYVKMARRMRGDADE